MVDILIGTTLLAFFLIFVGAAEASDRLRSSKPSLRLPPLGSSPTREEIFEWVRYIIYNNFGVDPSEITMQTRLQEDLEADDLDLAALFMDFEDKLPIGGITEEEAETFETVTVGDVVNWIAADIAAQSTPS